MADTLTNDGARGRWALDGSWRLTHFAEGEHCLGAPADLRSAGLPAVEARVPGNVELDLVRTGELPDPFFGDNVERLRALETHEWWYERELSTPDTAGCCALSLVFEGLDCFATVWLNDQLVGQSANAMIAHRFDVTGLLAPPGETNRLTVRLRSPVNAVRGIPLSPHDFAQPQCYDGLWARKPPHCYGWDITPRVVSAGIWRPVYLEEQRATEIEDVYVRTCRADAAGADLAVFYQLRTDAASLEGFSLRISGRCALSEFRHVQPVPFVAGQFRVHVPSPALWWPRGYGKADLYDVRVELLQKDHVLAARQQKVGIRTVSLDRTDLNSEDEPGAFRFVVNGVPVFAKGSNWVPADAFHSRDAARIPRMLALFAELDCNMVRCWGGNVYEPHLFYDICDREGIMVWQDFAMACAMYPQEDAFLDCMREEAEWVVRELRRHACIVLWAGDNECDMAYLGWSGTCVDPGTNRITREVLPHVVQRLDPDRPYLPSSPYISPPVYAKGRGQDTAPEQHLWGPRDYYKSRFYTENDACFASEIGYHGCPAVSSIRRFLPEDGLWPWEGNRLWQVHATDPVIGVSQMAYRVKLMADQVGEVFGETPDGIEEFALASQIVQAEAKKFFVELFRLRKGRTAGILWWNVIDCWPQFSDAVVDYYFVRKLAFHYLKRVQRPLCVMIREPESWHADVVVSNDSREEREGSLRVVDADTRDVVFESDFRIGANANRTIGRLGVSRGAQRLFLITWRYGREEGANHYLLGTPPFPLERYRHWLPAIAQLDGSFEAADVAR